MDKKLLNDLVSSLQEAKAIKKGRKAPARRFVIKPMSIKTIRKKLSVSQSEFALMIGVSKYTLQNWEQGRRTPEGPARALLKVASVNPQAVYQALHS